MSLKAQLEALDRYCELMRQQGKPLPRELRIFASNGQFEKQYPGGLYRGLKVKAVRKPSK